MGYTGYGIPVLTRGKGAVFIVVPLFGLYSIERLAAAADDNVDQVFNLDRQLLYKPLKWSRRVCLADTTSPPNSHC